MSTETKLVKRHVVTCSDGVVRHDGFVTRAEADRWLEWGHICLKRHTVEIVEVHPDAV